MSELINIIKSNSDKKIQERIDDILSVNDILNLKRDTLYCSFDFNMEKIASIYLFFETNKLNSKNIKNAILKILDINNKNELSDSIISTNKNLMKQMNKITNPIYGIGVDLRNIQNPEIKTYYRINEINEYIDEHNKIYSEKTNIENMFLNIQNCMNINDIKCSFLDKIKENIYLLDIVIETIGVDYLSNGEKELKLYCSIDKEKRINENNTKKVILLNKEMSKIANTDKDLINEIINEIEQLDKNNIKINTTCLSIKNNELIEIKNTIDTNIIIKDNILNVDDKEIDLITDNLFKIEKIEIKEKINKFKSMNLIPDGFGYDFNNNSIRKKIYLIPNSCLIKT